MVTVRNLKHTTGRQPQGADTWEEYWTQKAGRPFTTCSNSTCPNDAEVGAHVIKAYSIDNHWYIVPLCRACNKLTSTFNVPANRLVPVNK